MDRMNWGPPEPSGTVSQTPDLANWDWANRGSTHVELGKSEPLPFQEGRELGHGVNGPVMEVEIKGVCVALKKIYCRQKVKPQDLREIEIIKKLRHPHIIQVVGSYIRGSYLGILLYPVATCDLTVFLEDIDYLQRFDDWDQSGPSKSLPQDHSERLERCSLVGRAIKSSEETEFLLDDILKSARARLWQSYRCIASAIEYLHENSIRHKDLKPHNILLSPDGLWITDFGQSTDFSDFSNSATSNGDRGTLKYCAPEVATFQRSGRSADIFSLGCIFLEMTAILNGYTLEEMAAYRPSMDRSFHSNLNSILRMFDSFGNTELSHLPMALTRQMINKNPAQRPDIANVSRMLALLQIFSGLEPDTFSITLCPEHKVPAIDWPMSAEPKEVYVTFGNTCHDQNQTAGAIQGDGRDRVPVVIFVDCTHAHLIEGVIFFQHCSAKAMTTVVFEPPFTRKSTLWGVYTIAALVFLKEGYQWGSGIARPVEMRPGVVRHALPIKWNLQMHLTYSARHMREVIV